MKLSFTTMATPGLGVLNSVKLAGKYGYDGIDLRVSDYMGELTPQASGKELLEVKNILASEGIRLSGLLCYNKSGGMGDAARQEMKEDIQRHLEIASILESPSIRIFAGNPEESENIDDSIKKTADTILEALRQDKTEVKILLQNHSHSFTLKQAVNLAEMVDSPLFGIVFSPDHCVLQKEDPRGFYGLVKKHSKQLYIADLNLEGSEYKSVLPGKGVVQLKDAYEIIGGADFDGWVTFKWEKIWHKELEEPDIALPFFREYIKVFEIG